ncbi:hypothetical protein OHA21_06165 [Actinoplanes sp. NBC_00393]|uniref:hypothetical protein n=1 Tax=Actinoplanes sp. NBC_00393 TaxID=2975953 RepID=UPI002E1EE115
MDAHETDADEVGAAPSVARLLLELRAHVSIDVRTAGRTVQVRPQGNNGVAVYVHPGGVDLAVEPEQANDVAMSIPGAYIKDPDDPNCFISVEAELIEPNYDTLLATAVQAVELRAAVQPAKAARARATRAPAAPKAPKAAKAPAKARPAPRPEPPICPVCRQYELLASGACPSGYC